ncbi:MAG TPA: stage V sporulation protein AC [Thermoanaerobacterales bacterium]|nr:stage V sporulation protein AC [Thermoanaerobacterales bacterium]
MAKKKNKGLTVRQQKYQELVKKHEPKPSTLKNTILAFIFGGIVCLIGQFFTDFYMKSMKLTPELARNPATVTMIFIGALLTGIGVFDKIAKYAGAGLSVPVTGFANSIVSSALEFKHEGLVHGIGGKMFMLAGSVIVSGVVTAFFIGLFYAIFLI